MSEMKWEELEIDITANPGEQEIEMDSEEDSASEEQDSDKQDQEDTTASSEKKPKKRTNKSNFKKLSESNKAKDARIQELEAKLASLDDEDGDDDDADEDSDVGQWYDKEEFLDFLIDNPEAAKLRKEIESALEEFPNSDFNKAFKYAKANLWSEESSSYKRFSTKGSSDVKTKKIKDLTMEEAVAKLWPAEFDIWKKSQKSEQDNPFG